MSRNTSSDARLVSKTLGRTFSVQPLASTVLRSTWALWPIVRIAVLSKRASRSLAQTGSALGGTPADDGKRFAALDVVCHVASRREVFL